MEIRGLDELPAGWCAYPYTSEGYRVNLSFKAATRSIFYWNHNEFWMIWTDAMPLCVFLMLAVAHWRQNGFQLSLATGVHLGAILSRLCSCAYHVYNCCSLRANQRLIHLDLIGICCMAFGSPWLYAVANQLDTLSNNPGFLAYTGTLAIQYTCCVGLFAHMLLSSADITKWRQPLLVVLAITGNYPVMRLDASHGASTPLARSAVLLLLWGYVVFYTLKFPERLFTSIAFDGSVCNSHVLWHLAAAGAQLCFVAMTFFPR
jgi:predicted membrane channel-forming protein YqfA (hemolysin III family)